MGRRHLPTRSAPTGYRSTPPPRGRRRSPEYGRATLAPSDLGRPGDVDIVTLCASTPSSRSFLFLSVRHTNGPQRAHAGRHRSRPRPPAPTPTPSLSLRSPQPLLPPRGHAPRPRRHLHHGRRRGRRDAGRAPRPQATFSAFFSTDRGRPTPPSNERAPPPRPRPWAAHVRATPDPRRPQPACPGAPPDDARATARARQRPREAGMRGRARQRRPRLRAGHDPLTHERSAFSATEDAGRFCWPRPLRYYRHDLCWHRLERQRTSTTCTRTAAPPRARVSSPRALRDHGGPSTSSVAKSISRLHRASAPPRDEREHPSAAAPTTSTRMAWVRPTASITPVATASPCSGSAARRTRPKPPVWEPLLHLADAGDGGEVWPGDAASAA